jgi:hypothetical protein
LDDPPVIDAVASADLRLEELDAGGGDGGVAGPHCRQGRGEVGGFRHVVEARHADVVRHAAAAFVQRAEDADSDVVAGGEDRAHLGYPAENLPGPVAGGGLPVGRDDRRDLRAGLGQRLLPSGQAALAIEPAAGSRHVPDGPVPGIEKAPRRLVRAGGLVDGRQRNRAPWITADPDQRDVLRDIVQRVVHPLDRGDDGQAGHPLVQVAADRLGQGSPVRRPNALDGDREALP